MDEKKDSFMRVRISYTVDFEEIVKEVAKLIEEVKYGDLTVKLHNLVKLLSEESNINVALEQIDDFRKQLAKIDMRMNDCSEILTGYQNTLFSLLPNEDIKIGKEVKKSLKK